MSDRTWHQDLWQKFCRWLAFRLPRDVIYYAGLRMIDRAAPDTPSSRVLLTAEDALGMWHWSDEAIHRYWWRRQ